MPRKKSRIYQFWQELRRRRVVHVVTVYASAAFVLIELINNLTGPLNLPGKLSTVAVLVLATGFPLAVILAWIYDLTPEGIEKTQPVKKGNEEQRVVVPNAWKIATFASFAVIAGLITWNILRNPGQMRSGDIRSLVILPFDNFTGDNQLEYFVSGMHASLVNDMGQISGLRVICNTSANAYKNTDMTASEIARELNVDGVVEASVLCLGDSLCMQFRLIDTHGDESLLWSSDFQDSKSQVLSLYNRITKQIAQEVKVELSPEEDRRLSVSRTVDPVAYDAYIKAQFHWERLTETDLDSARHYFQLAIRLDPDWAAPYGGMAMTLGAMGGFSSSADADTYRNAAFFLEKALELDPEDAYTHYVKGIFAVWPRGQWKVGEAEMRQCLELNPGDALCRIYYAHLLLILHRFDEALEQAQTALELDPLRPLVLGLYGVVMYYIGDPQEALEQSEKALAIDPQNGFAINPLAGAALQLGDTARWYEIWKQGLWWTTPVYLDSLDRVFREQGRLAVIRDRIRINEEVLASGGVISFSGQAERYLDIGDFDKAMDYYELALEGGDKGFLSYMSLDYLFFPELQNNPRYLAILDRMKLPHPR